MEYTESLARELKAVTYHRDGIRVEIDDRDIGGTRGWDWIKKGIPVRVEIGPRDIAEKAVFVGRRDRDHRDRSAMPRDAFVENLPALLDDIQKTLFERAKAFRETHTANIDDKNAFHEFFTPKDTEKAEIHGGFAMSHWCGDEKCETAVKEELQVTIRCIPLHNDAEDGACICCGKPSRERVVFAKAY